MQNNDGLKLRPKPSTYGHKQWVYIDGLGT